MKLGLQLSSPHGIYTIQNTLCKYKYKFDKNTKYKIQFAIKILHRIAPSVLAYKLFPHQIRTDNTKHSNEKYKQKCSEKTM